MTINYYATHPYSLRDHRDDHQMLNLPNSEEIGVSLNRPVYVGYKINGLIVCDMDKYHTSVSDPDEVDTIPNPVDDLADNFLHSPEHVKFSSAKTIPNV